ncbi:MAG: MFS transporter [Ruminiclostridium sp.]|nr:MFS transporter [Ruminiclostridium sp.]
MNVSTKHIYTGRITDQRKIRQLFLLCFSVYFVTYLGRLSYSVSLVEIIRVEGFDKGKAGMIGTMFFFSYGLSQLFSGFLGDILPAKWLVLGALTVSGVSNVLMGRMPTPELMAAVWCVNGIAQAFIWSPLLRTLCEYMPEEERTKRCLHLNYSVPLGTVISYILSATLINAFQWRWAFYVPAVCLFAMGAAWYISMGFMERYVKKIRSGEPGVEEANTDQAEMQEEPKQRTEARPYSWKHLLVASGLFGLLPALFVQGALKDGVATWVPTFLQENYDTSSMVSILSTIVIPVCNLFGVALASMVDRLLRKDEAFGSAVFFGACGSALLVLLLWVQNHMLVALAMFTLCTTSMMAVNTILTAALPARFARTGRASSIYGIINSCVYAGTALSTYGIGALSTAYGWNATIRVWVIGAFLAMAVCFIVSRKWRIFISKYEW